MESGTPGPGSRENQIEPRSPESRIKTPFTLSSMVALSRGLGIADARFLVPPGLGGRGRRTNSSAIWGAAASQGGGLLGYQGPKSGPKSG